MTKLAPAVSVIVPMFDAEKYIAECLESLLAQTFTNFEVVIVNDCSTDSSCAIVESYSEKFGDRLTLSHTDKNSGSGALPRNEGLKISRGDYVLIMDNDDLLTPTALEELYTLAKKFDADVVHCEKYFKTNENLSEVSIASEELAEFFVDKPTLETENLTERVRFLTEGKYWVPEWTNLVRRSLLIEHEIFFPCCTVGDDNIWTYILIFYAKKYLRVPNVVYFWRQNENSIMRRIKTPQQTINFQFDPLLLGLKTLDEKLGRHEFFRQNPVLRYAVSEYCCGVLFGALFDAGFQLQPFEIYKTIRQNFGDKLGNCDVLIPILCSTLITFKKIHAINEQNFNEFARAANNRIAQLEAELQCFRS